LPIDSMAPNPTEPPAASASAVLPHHRAGAARDPAAWRTARVPDCLDTRAAEAFCREVAGRHYENFTVATRLVPARLRQDLANVYAFARWSDDLADEAASPAEARQALADWRRRLDECFGGRPSHPVFIALAETARRNGLSIDPFSDLLAAFEEDQAFDESGVAVRYATRGELLDYCRRSADPVGRIVLALEGCRDPELQAMSDGICTGLQLVNFWQDLRRDRLAGRVYLPREDMIRHGVDPAALDATRASPALVALLRDEVEWARRCFDAGAPLERKAPAVLRPAIGMFLAGGRSLAAAIERAGFDTLVRRPTVGRMTKLRLACRAWWQLKTTPSEGRA
jgi:squalene synthase HpnC